MLNDRKRRVGEQGERSRRKSNRPIQARGRERRFAEKMEEGRRAALQRRGLNSPIWFSVSDSAACNDTRRAKGQRIAFDCQIPPSSALGLSVDAFCTYLLRLSYWSLPGVSRPLPATRVRNVSQPTDASTLVQLVCARGTYLPSETLSSCPERVSKSTAAFARTCLGSRCTAGSPPTRAGWLCSLSRLGPA